MNRSSGTRRGTFDVLAAVAVALSPLVYFLPALRGDLVLTTDDGISFNVPLRMAAARMLLEGHLPLWNPFIFGGLPLHGTAQAGLLFPLNWFYLVLSAPVATNVMMLATYGLTAVGTYLYARRSGAAISGALVASLVYQWSGFLIAHVGHTNIVHTAALLPWVLWAVDGYGLSGRRSRGVVLAVLVALQVFAGHQQTLVYALLVAGSYAVYMWRAGEYRPAYGRGALLLIAAGVMLAAVQLVPTYELNRHSMRPVGSYDFFTSQSLPPSFLWALLAPYLLGGGDGSVFRAPYVGPPYYGEYIGYVGVGTVMLAMLAVVLRRDDRRTRFWAAVALAGLAVALERLWPSELYRLLYYIPVLNLFRVPARHLMEVDFALAVLAGRAITALTTDAPHWRASRWAVGVGASAFVLTCLAVTIGRPEQLRLAPDAPATLWRTPELCVPIAVAAVSALALWRFARSRSAASLVALGAILVLDLCLWGQTSGWRTRSPGWEHELWREFDPLAALRARAAEHYRLLTFSGTLDPGGQARNWSMYPLLPNAYMPHGMQNAAGYDGFGLGRYSRLAGDMTHWGELPDPHASLLGAGRELDVLNVRYLLAGRPAGTDALSNGADDARWRVVWRGDQLLIYENSRVLPRVWLAAEAVVMTEQAVLQTIRTAKLPDGNAWDPRRTALVEVPSHLPGAAPESRRADIVAYEPNRIAVMTACSTPSLLVVSENHYPGWYATIDGHGAQVLRVDYNLRGVALPAGAHQVELVYRPRSVAIGLAISLLGAALLLYLVARAFCPTPASTPSHRRAGVRSPPQRFPTPPW